MLDVFISYSRRNLDFIEQVAKVLTQSGKNIWFDKSKEPLQGIPAGSRWWDEIQQGIESADNFLFIISPESVTSPYCHAEIAHALHHEKRIVTLLLSENQSQGTTLTAIDKAIDQIDVNLEISTSVSADITHVRSLARRNWLELGQIQYVAFEDNRDFDRDMRQLINALDLDLQWIRTFSQFRQAVQIWNENDQSQEYRWTEPRLKLIRDEIHNRDKDLSDLEQAFLEAEQDRLLRELENIDTPHYRRLDIGKRLSFIGDTRLGIGLRPDGLPDITWCEVSAGEITIKDHHFDVPRFFIAQYLITHQQFQVFVEVEDGFEEERWWTDFPTRHVKQEVITEVTPLPNSPRASVSWYQAVAFTRWLNYRLVGQTFTAINNSASQFTLGADWQITLPTEWQWQHAATGGNPANDYPWSENGQISLPTEWQSEWQQWQNTAMNGNPANDYPWGTWDGRCANTREAGIGRTAVGMYPAGQARCGALDMAGNLREWCLNSSDNIQVCDIDESKSNYRVLRGGSHSDSLDFARAAARYWNVPSHDNHAYGFRVVCSPLSL